MAADETSDANEEPVAPAEDSAQTEDSVEALAQAEAEQQAADPAEATVTEKVEKKPRRSRAKRASAKAATEDERDEVDASGETDSAGEDADAAEEAVEERKPARRRRARSRAAETEEAEPELEPEPEPEPVFYDDRPVRAVRAQARYVRTSARKARLVCDHLRGKSVEEARAILAFNPRGVARDWSKVLESAVANAENNHELVAEDLVVREAFADEGPTIKRFQPRARGRASAIRKRTSHLTITLVPERR